MRRTENALEASIRERLVLGWLAVPQLAERLAEQRDKYDVTMDRLRNAVKASSHGMLN